MSETFGAGRQLGNDVNHLLGEAESYAQTGGARVGTLKDGTSTVISFRGVSTSVDDVAALHDVDLDIEANTSTAVIGALGIAKSALMELMLGRRVPEQGEVHVLGRSVYDLTDAELHQRSTVVGVALRDGGLMSSMSLRENIGVLLRNELGLSPPEVDELVDEELEQLGLDMVADLLPENVGVSQHKRAGLARAFVMQPPIMLFDEPESGLAAPMARMFEELLGHLYAKRGGTWVVFTSDFDLARRLAGRLVLTRRGRVLAAGSLATLQNSENPYVRALMERGIDA